MVFGDEVTVFNFSLSRKSAGGQYLSGFSIYLISIEIVSIGLVVYFRVGFVNLSTRACV